MFWTERGIPIDNLILDKFLIIMNKTFSKLYIEWPEI